jgi:hypothetical protein
LFSFVADELNYYHHFEPLVVLLPLPGSSAAIDRWKDLSTVCVYLFPPSKVTPEKKLIIFLL